MAEKKQPRKSTKAAAKPASKSRATKGSIRVDDLEVKKTAAAGVKGGVGAKTQLSGPYDDRSGNTYTASGDPGVK